MKQQCETDIPVCPSEPLREVDIPVCHSKPLREADIPVCHPEPLCEADIPVCPFEPLCEADIPVCHSKGLQDKQTGMSAPHFEITPRQVPHWTCDGMPFHPLPAWDRRTPVLFFTKHLNLTTNQQEGDTP